MKKRNHFSDSPAILVKYGKPGKACGGFKSLLGSGTLLSRIGSQIAAHVVEAEEKMMPPCQHYWQTHFCLQYKRRIDKKMCAQNSGERGFYYFNPHCPEVLVLVSIKPRLFQPRNSRKANRDSPRQERWVRSRDAPQRC